MKTKLKNDPTEKLEETYQGKWRNIHFFSNGDSICNVKKSYDSMDLAFQASEKWKATMPDFTKDHDGRFTFKGVPYNWNTYSFTIQMPVGDQ